jgi:hypothetical protein
MMLGHGGAPRLEDGRRLAKPVETPVGATGDTARCREYAQAAMTHHPGRARTTPLLEVPYGRIVDWGDRNADEAR